MKKSIKIFALLAIAGAMTFVGCKKDDETAEAVKVETMKVTFGNEVIPMGWFGATYDGTYCDFEAAAAYLAGAKGSVATVTLPYAYMSFDANEEIFDGIFNQHANRMYNSCEWAYDDEGDQDLTISGLDLTKLTLESAIAHMTMFDYYAQEMEEEALPDTEMGFTATNIRFEEIDIAKKGAKRNYNFQ